MSTYSVPFHLPTTFHDGFNLAKRKYIEVEKSSKVYPLLNTWIPSNLDPKGVDPKVISSNLLSNSYKIDVPPRKGTDSDENSRNGFFVGHNTTPQKSEKIVEIGLSFGRINMLTGIGFFAFLDHKGNKIIGLHQRLGEPVGTSCGVDQLISWILFTEENGKIDTLAEFLSHLVELSEHTIPGFFITYTYSPRHMMWMREASCKARSWESVILPEATKTKMMIDVQRFLDPKTKGFYGHHGIPYRRSYLFHGLPGTGKTSLIQAIAGHFKRSISFLQPSNPEMTDDALRSAMVRLPADTIVVFEDIDSLFDKDRTNKVGKSPLTFSGLLNALDGVGSSDGQLVIMTTNFRHQLDSALIRNGRVDLHVEFTWANEEQMIAMWGRFYPESAGLGKEFYNSVVKVLGDKRIVTSALQHFFVQNMYSKAEEALGNVGMILEEVRLREEEEEERKKVEEEKKKKELEEAEKVKARLALLNEPK